MGLPLELTGDSDLSVNSVLGGNGDLGDPGGLAVLFLDGENVRSSVEPFCFAFWSGDVRRRLSAPCSEDAWRSMWFL